MSVEGLLGFITACQIANPFLTLSFVIVTLSVISVLVICSSKGRRSDDQTATLNNNNYVSPSVDSPKPKATPKQKGVKHSSERKKNKMEKVARPKEIDKLHVKKEPVKLEKCSTHSQKQKLKCDLNESIRNQNKPKEDWDDKEPEAENESDPEVKAEKSKELSLERPNLSSARSLEVLDQHDSNFAKSHTKNKPGQPKSEATQTSCSIMKTTERRSRAIKKSKMFRRKPLESPT